MNKCINCKYYDSSVDACNAEEDDACYTDGIKQGRADERTKVLAILNQQTCEDYKQNKNPRWCMRVDCRSCMIEQIKEQTNG